MIACDNCQSTEDVQRVTIAIKGETICAENSVEFCKKCLDSIAAGAHTVLRPVNHHGLTGGLGASDAESTAQAVASPETATVPALSQPAPGAVPDTVPAPSAVADPETLSDPATEQAVEAPETAPDRVATDA